MLVTSVFDTVIINTRIGNGGKKKFEYSSSDNAVNLCDDPDSTSYITPNFNEVITNCDLTDMEGKGTELFEYIPQFYTA